MRARGLDAHSEPHRDWQEIAGKLARQYAANKGPIALIGHSWGALAAVLVADELEKSNIPVALIILYDTTDSVKIPPNVRRVINFSSSTTIGLGITVAGEYGFAGKIENVNVPQVNHLDMDNAPALHEQSINAVLQAIKPRAKVTG
jgi:pimeloyl-ACP methyl ester carboxylesterase